MVTCGLRGEHIVPYKLAEKEDLPSVNTISSQHPNSMRPPISQGMKHEFLPNISIKFGSQGKDEGIDIGGGTGGNSSWEAGDGIHVVANETPE